MNIQVSYQGIAYRALRSTCKWIGDEQVCYWY